MEITVRVPLHHYLDIEEPDTISVSNCVLSVTSGTIRISFKNTENVFYGIYPCLPKIHYCEVIKKTIPLIENGYNIVNGNRFKDIQKITKVNPLYIGQDERSGLYFIAYKVEVPDKEVMQTIEKFIQEFKDNCGYKSATTGSYKNYISKEKEGQNNMANNLFGDIRVGKAGSKYTLTYFGTIAYNGKTYYQDRIFDASGMTINFDMLYMVPTNKVEKGDIIEKGNKAYYVLNVNNGVVKAVDLVDGTEENLVPGGVFGMTMYSKIFNPMGNMSGDNSFGNMLMMQALMGDGDSGNGNNGMLLAMMMMQGGFKFPTFEMPKFPEAESKTESKE